MIVDKIKKLKETGLYPCLVKGGVISLTVNVYFEMYERYQVRLKVNQNLKNCIMQSITDVADEFKYSERTVRKAIDFMRNEV